LANQYVEQNATIMLSRMPPMQPRLSRMTSPAECYLWVKQTAFSKARKLLLVRWTTAIRELSKLLLNS